MDNCGEPASSYGRYCVVSCLSAEHPTTDTTTLPRTPKPTCAVSDQNSARGEKCEILCTFDLIYFQVPGFENYSYLDRVR